MRRTVARPAGSGMELDCFLFPGWDPRIRPAERRRDWMDRTPESFAYRCLPLAIANAHGWEVANATGFRARWHGGSDAGEVEIVLDDAGADPVTAPVSLFGQGTITFHVAGLLRTPPGWNLWVGGPPNAAKHGIAPLGGVVETDWSPYTFTMNWRFTRAHEWVRFEPGEAIAFFFPVQRGIVEAIEPRYRPIDEAPELRGQFEAWSRSRDAFHAAMRDHPPASPADKWQKLYYRGVCPDGGAGAADHQSKLRARPFTPPLPQAPPPAPAACPVAHAPSPARRLARRDWLLRVQGELRALSPAADEIYRYDRIDPRTFLDDHYAANRPAILAGEIAGWPALARWTPDYLAARVGDAEIVHQGGREPFAALIRRIAAPDAGDDACLAAFDAGANAAALAPLRAEMGRIDTLLAHGEAADEGLLRIEPGRAFAPLRPALANSLLVQIVGTRRVILMPPSETPLLPEGEHGSGAIGNVLDPANAQRFPELLKVRLFEVVLVPGEALFLPIGWWHQVEALAFSASATYTNFPWRNDWDRDYPGD